MVAVLDQMSATTSSDQPANYSWRRISNAIRNIETGDEVSQNLEYLARARESLAARILGKLNSASTVITEEGIAPADFYRHALSANPERVGYRVMELARVHRELERHGHPASPHPQHQTLCTIVDDQEVETASRTTRPRFARLEAAQARILAS